MVSWINLRHAERILAMHPGYNIVHAMRVHASKPSAHTQPPVAKERTTLQRHKQRSRIEHLQLQPSAAPAAASTAVEPRRPLPTPLASACTQALVCDKRIATTRNDARSGAKRSNMVRRLKWKPDHVGHLISDHEWSGVLSPKKLAPV